MSSATSHLDPYTAQAQHDNATPHEKIDDLKKIIKSAKTGMLTTHSAGGQFHSRAMTPASPSSDTQLSLIFLANNASHKFAEIENDANVNVSFFDTNTTTWASFSGKAKITRDKETVKKHWSTYTSAYFGDLKDGIHKGDETDPRVSVIEVIPEEIRYFVATKGTLGRAVEAGVDALTGKTAAPGELRTITREEIQLTQSLHTKY